MVNGYAAWKLSSGKTMNERVVSRHLLEDVLGWAAVLVVAIVLRLRYPLPRSALSMAITLYILYNVVRRSEGYTCTFSSVRGAGGRHD